jgi:hypothetical protein
MRKVPAGTETIFGDRKAGVEKPSMSDGVEEEKRPIRTKRKRRLKRRIA